MTLGAIGRFPTPVRRITGRGLTAELWLKDDGQTDPRYGGNKARKLARVLPIAHARGARRLVTFGAAGSHHALATTLFGRAAGWDVLVVLWPQPTSAHAEKTLRHTLSAGAEIVAVNSPLLAGPAAALRRRTGDFWIAPGAMSEAATLSYADAVDELTDPIREGELPEPRTIVVAAGTGGTAAGLLAGIVRGRLRARLLAVNVVGVPDVALRELIVAQTQAGLRRAGIRSRRGALLERLSVESNPSGGGYGTRSAAGHLAARRAEAAGVELDPTYTEKSFASALAVTGAPEFAKLYPKIRLAWPSPTLYWHTLSAAPAPLSTPGREGAFKALQRELFTS